MDHGIARPLPGHVYGVFISRIYPFFGGPIIGQLKNALKDTKKVIHPYGNKN